MKRLLSIGLSLLSLSALSGVNLKNGNFYISYTDIYSVSQGKKLEIVRTYNSKAIRKGWFGYGWGNPFETKLETSPDGSIIVHENGTGGKAIYAPKKGIKKETVQKVVDRIIEKMRKKSSVTKTSEQSLRSELVKNNLLRHETARSLGIVRTYKTGTKLFSRSGATATVEVTKKGFKRVFQSGKIEVYDKDGYLRVYSDSPGYKVKLTYNKAKKVTNISDTAGNGFKLDWFSSGYVKSIKGRGKNQAEYLFEGDDLVKATDIEGQAYAYQYDKFHNLTHVTDLNLKDKSKATLKISYTPKSFFTSKVIDRSGEVTKYFYDSDPSNPELHYWTTVVRQGFDGKPFANRYEYEFRRREDGSTWAFRKKFLTGGSYNTSTKKVVGGLLRETILNECCGLPVQITEDKKTTKFKYVNGKMVSKRSNDGEFVDLTYDKANDKIIKVVNNDGTFMYQYNKRRELRMAQDDQGQNFVLTYDFKGQLTQLVESLKGRKNRRVIKISYNSDGMPEKVILEGKGYIKFDSNAYGATRSIAEQKGDIALDINSIFSEFLTIVKPSGVNFSL